MSGDIMPPIAISKLTQALCATDEVSIDQFQDILSLFELLSEQIIVTDSDGTIMYANPAAEKITGYPVQELVGKTPALWGKQMDADFYKNLWNTISTKKERFVGSLRNKRKDGVLYDAELQIQPLLDTRGTVRFYVGIERDVSKTMQLQRAQRKFIALASHNLKTPLASMRWYAEMMLDGDVGRLSKGQREYVNEILDAAKRMVLLIRQWLTISRVDLGMYTFHNEALNVDDLIESVLADLQQRIDSSQITAHFKTNPSPCIMVADRDVMHTIVHALLLNAVKYNRPGGTIEASTAIVHADTVVGEKSFPDTRVVLSVHDTGIGIPEQDKPRVFQQFFRASNVERLQIQGVGLSLFLAHELVHMLGGEIWFTSSDAGSDFYVALPTNAVVDENVVTTNMLEPNSIY